MRKFINNHPNLIPLDRTLGDSSTPWVFATGNQAKLQEFRRILNQEVTGIDLKVAEIQDEDPEAVVKHKAVEAWGKNGSSPIIVEDTSLSIPALDGLPATLADSFTKTPLRRLKLLEWLKGTKDRRAVAKVLLAVFDGQKVQIRGGETFGRIADSPRGNQGFGWDDVFIPDGQPAGEEKTFAEMSESEKDSYSMRRKALTEVKKNPFLAERPIFQLPEPYADEMERIRFEEFSPGARQFAFALECLEKSNRVNDKLTALHYLPVVEEHHGAFYSRYSSKPDSASLGLILTNIEKDRIKRFSNGDPVIWQMGPRRRTLALAQRAWLFDQSQNRKIYEHIAAVESGELERRSRPNRRQIALEEALGVKNHLSAVRTPAFTEIGYRKLPAEAKVSRRQIASEDLFNRVGRFPRRIIGLGSMPPVSGWRDTLVTAAVAHLVSFIPRNSVFAGNPARQIKLYQQVKEAILKLSLPEKQQAMILRNIGISLGCEQPLEELKNAKKYFEVGLRLFRIYTINADPRVLEVTRLLRREFGDEIEIFVGQVVGKKQADYLIVSDIRADALIFGHGGGRQCTSAINGMAISTLENIYEVVRDPRFNGVSLLLEGGVDKSVGVALILGADCVLYNQKLVHGAIEAGDLFVEDKNGEFCQPYPGDASPPTQLIESLNPLLRKRRTNPAGRTYTPEGSPGFMYYEAKGSSMAFWIEELLSFAARTLADLGVDDINGLRELLSDQKLEVLRILSPQAQYFAGAYKNG